MNSGPGLPLLFSKIFQGIVWGTFAVPEKNILIAEIRKPEIFETSFTAWNYLTHAVLWDDFKLEEHWWITPVASSQGVLFLQTYVHGANPNMKGLIAMDIISPRTLWRHGDFAFHDVNSEYVLGYSLSKDWSPASIHIQSGKVTEGFRGAAPTAPAQDHLFTPIAYYEDSPHFSTCAKFLAQHTKEPPIGVIEYLEHQGKILMGYYVKEAESLANYLLVVSQDGAVALHERLGEGLGRETFFVVGGCLIFVKNKSQLLSYSIS